MTNWQEDFSRYATSVAFSVQLSKAQVLALDAIATKQWNNGRFHMFFATAGALKRRGLAEYNNQRESDPSWIYRLTPAGEVVLDLCRLSGALPSIQKLEARDAPLP